MFEKTDEQLITSALAGNKRAWLGLISRYEKSIYNYGVRMTGNQADALDLMQDVFVSVFRNLASYRGEGSFKNWLFRIAHFRCVEYYRRKRPMQSLDDEPELKAEQTCLEQGVADGQLGNHLSNAMQQLPLSQKAIVELKFFGQFTFEEIAEQLGISTNTAKSRLYSALSKLRSSLEVDYA
ncbi:RNA polymerase sigma factor [Aestuariibacter salexigens]|uniref:RNA polymerase sigma factor n=1 Tax=Aestuariibacter salexigens TaxID=226010 RepID=UPI000424AF91|nr:sigma-70 family RNA polymerase sigma factor [Aestuariibacter salexigens]